MASHCCGKGDTQHLCCSLLCVAQVRYQMARLPPALICVKTEGERSQASLTWEFWELYLQVSACLISLLGKHDQERFVLHSSRLSWVDPRCLGGLCCLCGQCSSCQQMSLGSHCLAVLSMSTMKKRRCVFSRESVFSFNGLNSFWMHLSYRTLLHFRIKEPLLSVVWGSLT